MRRGWWILLTLGLLTIGVVGAVLSVKLRRTQTQKTEQFFGEQTITALQSSAIFRLRFPADGALVSKMEASDGTVDIASVPGVGHLRHAFLDQRHYDWSTAKPVAIDQFSGVSQPEWVKIELEGTPAGFAEIKPVTLQVELSEGWVGLPSQPGVVQFNDRVSPAVRKQIMTMSNVRSTRADLP